MEGEGRNWNCDPRSKDTYEDSPGADFYTFETSGGIMYFGQTKQAHSLLDAWIQATELPGMEKKADDRILSLIFNNLRMYLPLNIIQLPIEYLWLSMIYGSKPLDGASRAHLEGVYSKALTEAAAERESAVDEKAAVAVERSINRLRRELLAIRKGFVDMSPMKIIRNGKVKYEDPWSYVFIEHPHCLTPEEVAREKSNATVNRQPVTYNRNVTESIGFRGGGWFHDYIFFDSEEQAKAFVPYQYYADTHTLYEDEYYNNNTNTEEVDEVPLFYHERYADRYGRFNAIAAENERLVLRLDRQTYKSPPSRTTECPAGEFTLSPPCKVVKNSKIPQILYYLQKGIDVLYVPPRAQPSYIKAVIKEAEEGNNQLITVNVSTMKPTSKPHDLKSEYRLTIPLDAPIYFGSRSKVLQHLLRMCRNLEDLPKLFNSSIVFLTRIRCKWVAATSSGATSIPAAAIINQTGSEAADALVNPESAAEQTAIIQTLPALITEQIPERGTNIQSVVITNLANKIKGIKLGGRRRRSQKMDTIRFLTKTRKNLRGRRA